MTMRLPPLNALRSFHVAARHRSLTKAAAALGVTHGAVSRQVAKLEDHLGVPLFRRTTRRIVLTAEGERLLEAAEQAFGLIEAGVASIAAPSRARPLAVSCIATFAMRWLIPRLPRFHAVCPDIEVRLSAPPSGPASVEMAAARDDLLPPDVEVAIGVTPFACPVDMRRVDFLPERVGPVLSPQALPSGRLDDAVLLETASRPEAWAEWTRAGGPIPSGRRGPRFETFYFMLQAAASGLGIAIGPWPLVEDDIVSGRLVAPHGFRPSGRCYYALYRKRAEADPRLQRFREWLLAEGRAAAATAGE